LGDKADLIEHDESFLRSERLSLPNPSVIRLRYVVKVPYHRRTSLSRRAVFARDDNRCQYCAGIADSLDHVMPRSRGGLHIWENVVAACRKCNLGKRDRTPDEAGMKLAKTPLIPKELAWVTVAAGSVPDLWKPYLAQL
jgi:5-methylcytosine-specific restriction endonuclease McrA